jgi:hypothetical protein
VIGVMPSRLRPLPRRRLLPYMRREARPARRARDRRAHGEVSVNHEDMLFDQPPAELPVASVRAHGRLALAAGLHRWFDARWRWLSPRMVPVLVAFAGMCAVIAAARYLATYTESPPERLVVKPMVDDHSVGALEWTATPPPSVDVVTGPPGTDVVIDRIVRPPDFVIELHPRN